MKGATVTDELNRRSFLSRSGALAVVAGALGASASNAVLPAAPAAATADSFDGRVYDEGGEVYDIKAAAWGAKGDTVIVEGAASIAAGSTTLSWPGGRFASADAGKVVTVQGAGANATVLSTTIASVQSATQATLALPAATSVSSAELAYGTDDTVAIANAIVAAEPALGTIFVPPGVYMIRGASNTSEAGTSQSWGLGMLTFGQTASGGGGVLGCGGRPGSDAASIFLCGDATAGLLLNGWAHYRGFQCDGNNIANVAIQNGVLEENSGSYGTFVDVWARRSAGNGWVILGNQNHSYYSCGSLDSALDGVYIDEGAAGLDFWNFQEANSGRYGVHGDFKIVTYGGAEYYTQAHFLGGTLRSDPGQRQGVSKVYLRNQVDWQFLGTTIIGDNLSGPTVDLYQSDLYGYGTDFSGCTVSSTLTPGGANPGHACFQISGTPVVQNRYTMVRTDGVRFLGGDTSVYIEAAGPWLYSARGWVQDSTANGPVAASGQPDIDTLLGGRTGRWVTAALQAPWTGSVFYRMGSDGVVQMKGSAQSSTGAGGQMFTLDSGYYPTSGSTLQLAAAMSNGQLGYVTVAASSSTTTGGALSGSAPGSGVSLHLDGISFPVS